MNFGAEVELTQHFNFMSDRLANFYMSGNVAYINSTVELGDNKGSATNSECYAGAIRYFGKRSVGYENIDTGMTATFSYNYTGDRVTRQC